MTEKLLEHLRRLNADLAPKYNKFYIGLAKDGRSNNFVSFKPKKEWLWLVLLC